MELTRNPRRVYSMIGLAMLALCAGMTWIGIPLSDWLAGLRLLPGASWSMWLLNDIPIYLIGMPLFLLVLHFIPDGTGRAARPAPFGPVLFLLALVVALGFIETGSFVTSGIYSLIGFMPGGPGQDMAGAMAADPPLVSLIFMCIIPAIGEEFIFRYMLRKKMRGAGDWNFILLSSLCFSLFHMNFNQTIYTFLAGLVFSWLYVRTEKLWMPMLLHFSVNAVPTFILPLLPEWAFPIYIISCIAGAAIILIVFRHKIFTVPAAPNEPGWPGRRHKAPAAKAVPVSDAFGDANPVVCEQTDIAQNAPLCGSTPWTGKNAVATRQTRMHPFVSIGMLLFILYAVISQVVQVMQS